MDRNKLGQLIRGSWADRLPEANTNQIFGAVEKAEVATDSDLYEPPGDIFTPNAPISKLIMPAVQIDPWSVFWLVLAATTGGIALLSYILLTAVPPQPNCQQIMMLTTDSERLYCTKMTVESNDSKEVIAAINLVKGWSERNPLYNDGKNLLNKWSQQLLEITKQELVAQGDLPKAIDSLNNIPPHSNVYADAQKDIAQWKKQWQEGQKINSTFQKAIQTGDWDAGHDALNKVRTINHSYWLTTRYSQMAIQLVQEKTGWEQYQDAERTARGEDLLADQKLSNSRQKKVLPLLSGEDEAVVYVLEPKTLAKAIELASKVTDGSYYKDKANAHREIWNQAILAIANEKLRVRKFAEAIAAAQQVPEGVKVYAAAQQVITQAQAAVQNNSMEVAADTVDNQIVLTKAWQTGESGSIAGLSAAVAIASQIPVEQPLGTEAQTFVKYWNQQILLIDDQPILLKARAFAKRGDLAHAIKTAKTLNRISYPIISNEVEQWQQTLTILTIRRDRPVLDRAQSLYRRHQWAAAKAAAHQIPPDSPLYGEAQTLLNRWQAANVKAQ